MSGYISFGPAPAVVGFTGAPSAGVNEVQTLDIGGTPTGGTFTLTFEGFTTAAITWSATNATLLANMVTALDALPNLGTAGVVPTAGTLTNGIGTILLTFSGAQVRRRVVPLMTAANSLTGTDPTLAITETTPGVAATLRQAPTGTVGIRTDTGAAYVNTSTTPNAPTWTAQV
jgi:hypothetical protein